MIRYEELPPINSSYWLNPEDFPEEVWRDIEGYEGKYQVSCYGRVKSLKYRRSSQERILILHKNKNIGYFNVGFYKNGKIKKYLVHRLVAEAFISNPYGKEQIDHCSTNKEDNTVINLSWATAKENMNNPLTLEKFSNPIIQLTKDGDFVAEYPSTREASRQTGINQGNISSCLNERYKSAGNFVWRYSTSN